MVTSDSTLLLYGSPHHPLVHICQCILEENPCISLLEILYTAQHVLGPCKLLVYEYIPVTCDRDPFDLRNTSDDGILPSTQILSEGSRLWYVNEMSSVRWAGRESRGWARLNRSVLLGKDQFLTRHCSIAVQRLMTPKSVKILLFR